MSLFLPPRRQRACPFKLPVRIHLGLPCRLFGGNLAKHGALALPLAAAKGALSRASRGLTIGAGLASVALGLAVMYRIGFVDGLFTANPRWTPG